MLKVRWGLLSRKPLTRQSGFPTVAHRTLHLSLRGAILRVSDTCAADKGLERLSPHFPTG
jgi:hypothetical protein